MTTSLRADILRNLERRSDIRQITVLGRQGRANHYTGSQLLTKAEQCWQQLDALLGGGRHVLVAALPAGESFLFPLLASLINEWTLVPVPSPRPSDLPERLRHIVQTCNATAVVCTVAHRQTVETHLRDAADRQICPVFAIDGPEQQLLAGSNHPAGMAIPVIQHTSGSTRFPKAVPITAAQIRANCAMIQKLWGMNPRTVMVNWLPH